MNRNNIKLTRRYQGALELHLKQGRHASLVSARGLGSQALAAGLQTLDLAKLHEQILIGQVLPGCPAVKRAGLVKQAGVFFAAAITPIESTHHSARDATVHLKRFVETLSQRTVELAASNLELKQEITQRKAVEKRLKNSERHYSHLLKQSNHLQDELRRLSRLILSAQEDERKKISRELHDVVAQTLTGINIRLANLKKEAALNSKGLDRNIARTQKLVQHSVNIIHRFARELRPTVLDDLGLIPALHTYMKGFRQQTGMQVSLSAFAAIEQLAGERRTVLYRIAQEALTNVGRHAQASQVDVKIKKLDGAVCMTIKDNGKGFLLADTLNSENKRLGLLGMRERLDMVGGKFTVKSAPGKGTTVLAQIPLTNQTLLAGNGLGNGA
ncbi:MAG TPA: sensor histidine kinase [Verrucomicrobiae bacterium]|nr:sensor histidine kinase [Verrucomicrobiae bacterium]